jgi:hypothetical protein
MTIIVEDGSGIIGANSYASVAYADSYFTLRGITTWTGANSLKEAALIKATDYIDLRFRRRFIGWKQFDPQEFAQNSLTFAGNAQEDDTVVIGTETYTFSEVPFGAFEVQIGSVITETVQNFIDIVNRDSTLVDASAVYDLKVLVRSKRKGHVGNYITTTSSIGGTTFLFPTLRGGNDQGIGQSLEFPRSHAYTISGVPILGVPDILKRATCEYALRALSQVLVPDPSSEDNGYIATRKFEKIGPIETDTEYLISRMDELKRYPAADYLITTLTNHGQGVVR